MYRNIDLTDLSFWARPPSERLDAFRRLRELDDPVFFRERKLPLVRPGTGFHALVRHADVLAASGTPRVFSSEPSTASPERPAWVLKLFDQGIVDMDDPRHAKLRRIIARAFTPKILNKIDADLQVSCARIVSDIVAEGAGNFVIQVSSRLPIQVICDMMGIPARQQAYVLERINTVTAYAGVRTSLPRTAQQVARNMLALRDLQHLVIRLGAERRRDPREDLISTLVNANVDGEALTDRQLGSFFNLLIVAGNETTRNALSHGLKYLTDHPDQRELLVEDFDKHIPGAIEEIVRMSSPIIQFRRRVTQDYVLNGHGLKEGEKVALFYNSANRDSSVFTDPDVFDVTRDPNRHVGFGGPGPHICLGAHLARREMTFMLRELFTRLPGIHAIGSPELLLSHFDHAVTRLDFTF